VVSAVPTGTGEPNAVPTTFNVGATVLLHSGLYVGFQLMLLVKSSHQPPVEDLAARSLIA
jgi:hypothetical protein